MHNVLHVCSVFFWLVPMWECLARGYPVGSWVLLPIPLTQLLCPVVSGIHFTYMDIAEENIYSFRTEVTQWVECRIGKQFAMEGGCPEQRYLTVAVAGGICYQICLKKSTLNARGKLQQLWLLIHSVIIMIIFYSSDEKSINEIISSTDVVVGHLSRL